MEIRQTMKTVLIFILFIFINRINYAQENAILEPDRTLPYYEITEVPDNYSGPMVAARMLDGLGFRFYWATAGLREEDLKFAPGKEARTSLETIAHIHNLTITTLNAIRKLPNTPENRPNPKGFPELRKQTLENIKKASEMLRESTENDLREYDIVFNSGENAITYPFWNLINGPIADALWHVGQLVSFRRSSGNPISKKVNVLTGKIQP